MKKDTNESFDLKNTTKYKRVGEYLGSQVKILFKCYKCANEWLVTPDKVLQGRGCPTCASTKYTNETYAQALLDKGIKYILKGTYISVRIKTEHECPDCNTTWLVRPHNILRGNGCPVCSTTGFDNSKQAYLYFIQIDTPHDSFLKVGITNREVSKRFSEIVKETNAIELTVIKIIEGLGTNIRDLEQKVLKSFNRYTTCEIFGGHTECLALEQKEEILKYLN